MDNTILALNSQFAKMPLEITALQPLIPIQKAKTHNLQYSLTSEPTLHCNSQISSLNSQVTILQANYNVNQSQPNCPT
jgi:hypothetical protein